MRFTKRIVAINVALLLFCTVVVAQNEKSNNEFGITLANSSVKLKSGNEKTLPVTLLDGFRDPILIYTGNGFEFNTLIKGKSFTAKIIKKGEIYSLVIKAKEGIKNAEQETIYIKAIKKKPGRNQKRANSETNQEPKYGFPLKISISPK